MSYKEDVLFVKMSVRSDGPHAYEYGCDRVFKDGHLADALVDFGVRACRHRIHLGGTAKGDVVGVRFAGRLCVTTCTSGWRV